MRIQGEAEGQGLCEDRHLLRVFEDVFRLRASVADAESRNSRLDIARIAVLVMTGMSMPPLNIKQEGIRMLKAAG